MTAQRKLTMEDILPACGHYVGTDELFLQGYNLLVDENDQGKKVLEVCCGAGDLSGTLAQVTQLEILAIDRLEQNIQTAKQKYNHLTNLEFLCEDATNLQKFESDRFDVIFGQATLHHLAHSTESLSKEYCRLLKAGGKLVFIFEPLGHNPLIAAIRAVRVAYAEMPDESNLFESTLRDIAVNFGRYEIYYFSLFAYFCKSLPRSSNLGMWLYEKLNALDQKLFVQYPRLRKFAANVNVCYWK